MNFSDELELLKISLFKDQFEMVIDHNMNSRYIDKINISNKASNIYPISEMKNLFLHLNGFYFESILTLSLRI